jgi:hypothetical protein
MSVTLRIPSTQPAGLFDDTVPYPKAYNRAKEFLKEMLKNEIDLAARAENPTLKPLRDLGTAEIVSHFRKQFLAFARQEWPFADFVPDGNTLAWWESLAHHPQAHVLAVSSTRNHPTCDSQFSYRCWRSKSIPPWSIPCLTSARGPRLLGSIHHCEQIKMFEHW